MKNIPEEEFIDIRKILNQVLSKWYYFAASLFLCLVLAYVHLKTTPKQYEVQATLQLEDQSINDNSLGRERFMGGGLGLLSGSPQLADEIGVLSSYSMVRRAIQELDFTMSYFQYPDNWLLGGRMGQEIYRSGFRVLPTEGRPQLVGVAVHVSFPDTAHYRVEVEADEANLFDLAQQKTIQEKLAVDIDETLPINQPFQSDMLSFRLFLDSGYVIQEDQHYSFRINTLNGLAQAYAGKLDITPISEESSIVQLKTEGRVPEKEKDFINTLANMYIQYDLSKKNQLGLRAIEFIDSQLSTVYDSLQLVEGNLESFRASDQIINISTTSQNLNEQLQELEAQQAELKVQQQYYQYTSNYLRNNEEVTDVVAPSSVGITDPLLNNLLQELSVMSQEKVEKAYSSGENNPVLRVLDGKIRNTKAALVENMDNLINSNQIAIKENQRRINRLEAQLNKLPESERNLIAIERKFSLNDNIYNYLLEKRAEAGIAIASNLPDKSVIDEARVMGGGPVAPKPTTILVLALLAGLGIPIALIQGINFFDNKVNDKSDLEDIQNTYVAGLIPRAPKGQRLASPGLLLSEAFRFLRLQLGQSQK
ncbi:MAG: GNVR domain-containing protein, partial [Tunicatimonas sp.]|uniref:GumC family protein n=1 Tax=Tunicatimonas sp. TaxID=1940096 RepID=UPI003C7285D8